ncbi:ABC transporter integral membrane type 1 [Penicillium hispanicum]|uniref:ABC transporter integral membrane type 1 n=1 Tax=Penicillium hispanicum TaxID=1080232 RepID=UPI0025419EB8|nr:ABC transporter integral membrane type 1 [Penicillium hispanicum]KAJ5579811.1 ABC transporter integral membrane type 1 [Penicillium hispanicum]
MKDMSHRAKRSRHEETTTPHENAPAFKPSWKSLFFFTTRKHIPALVVGSLFALFAGCVTPVLAVLLGDVFDSFTSFGAGQIDTDGLHGRIITSCFGMIGLGAAGWFLNGAYFMVFVAFGELQAASIRSKVFVELLKRDVEWFEAQTEGSGAFLSGIQAQIRDLQMATSQPLGLLLQYSCRSLASLGLSFYTSWSLSLVTLAGIPVFSSAIAFLSSRMKYSITAQQAELTHASKIANNAIASIDTVKCLNAQASESRNFATRIEKSAIHYLRQARLNSLQIAFIRWMMFGMFVQGFWYGSTLARHGKLSSGEVIRTFWACLTAAQSIEQVLPQMIIMEKGKVASVTLNLLMRNSGTSNVVSERNGTLYPGHCEGDIEVNNVSFAYPTQPDAIVLKPSTFFFPAGETTFVIGKSGSGKSTLSQLLMRFYLPSFGDILIDGHRLKELNINWIRNNVTLVEQRSVLFNDSVRQNIVFGRQDQTTVNVDDIQQSIELSMLQSTIDGLPDGLETCVGPGGSFLSGGQRQRVAIARAKLRDSPILILDEPTSALDHTNRVAVMKSVREWRKGKTTIIITHDMSQILENDFVYILEHGSVVESGYRNQVEKRPGSEKYFHWTSNRVTETTKPPSLSYDKEGGSSWDNMDTSSTDSEDERPAMPRRAHHKRNASWAQHHIPPSFRSSTYGMAAKRHSTYSMRSEHNVELMANHQFHRHSSLGFPKTGLSREVMKDYMQTSDQEVEMTEIDNRQLENGDSLQANPSLVLHSLDHSKNLAPDRVRRKWSRRKAKDNKFTSLSQIMSTIVPNLTTKQRVILFFGISSALAHASATPIFSYCLSQLVGTFYARSNSAKLTMKWSLAVLGVSIGDGISSYFMHYFLEFSGEAWMDTLRKKALQRVLDQPRSWFEKDGNGSFRLASYLDQNGEDMRNLLGRFTGFVIVAAAITVMAIIWSLAVCWKLTLVALACGPVIYTITRGFEGTNGRWERKCSAASTVASDIFTETFSEIRTVRTLTLEGYFHRKQSKAILWSLRMGLKRAIYTGLLFGMVESTVIFASALIFYYGAVLVAYEFTVNDVVMVFSLLLFSIGYAAQILSWIPQINTSREIATQLLRLAHLSEAASHESHGVLKLSSLTPVKLKNVNFCYPSRPNTTVLKNLSIQIEQNSCTAIVGRSGSGKSTIASLILALYEAPVSRDGQPTITLGGHDILHLHVPTLRSQIAVVSQQPTIFPCTIQANISYGIEEKSPMASLQQVRAAAQAAGIDDFISSLPNGYLTVIGDGGIGLSGGQKQRVVIARALLRHPQILILDEATSSLDPTGAELVRQTVKQLVRARRDLTVIIITHSREMIEVADHVIVLDQGTVVEDVVEDGLYRSLAKRVGGKAA